MILCQVVVLYTVIVVSIYNLTVGHGDSTLWTALLSSSLGYLLPNPSMKRDDGVWFLPSFTKQLVNGHTPEQYVGAVYHKPTATDKSTWRLGVWAHRDTLPARLVQRSKHQNGCGT